MYCLDFFLRTFGLVGYDAPFTRERPRVRFAQGVIIINIPLRIKIKIYYNINIYMSTYTEVSIKNKVELILALFQSNINTSKWGKGEAKSVDDLLKEIMAGETLLLKDGNNKLVRIVSAVWVKMIFNINASNKAKLLPPSALADDSALGNYYLIETCNYSQTGPIPFVDIQFKKESKIHSRYLTENMVLPNYKGKPLAGKQTKEDTKEADIRSGAIETALREIKEELNITLPYKGKNDPFDPDIFVEWYPKVIKGGSKCESKVADAGVKQLACHKNSLKKQKDTISKDAKLVTWEWIKESPDAIKANSIEQIPDITLAKSSNSYPGLGTLYKIIHLRTKNLEEFDWGKQWINASEGKDAHRPNKLNEKVESQEIIQYYPPPYQPWQEEEGITTPLCFNVYENPKAAPTAATVVPLKHQEAKTAPSTSTATSAAPAATTTTTTATTTATTTTATTAATTTTTTATKAPPAATSTTATTATSTTKTATTKTATKGGNKRKQKKTRNKKGKKKKGTRRRKRKKRTKN